MDELRVNSRFTQAELWDMTPRQMSAWLFVARKRQSRDEKRRLAMMRMAMHGTGQQLAKLLKSDE